MTEKSEAMRRAPKPDAIKAFGLRNDAKIYRFQCTFEGEYSSNANEFKDAMSRQKYKVQDLGLQTIDCWGPSPHDCAYGHPINVHLPRPKPLSTPAIRKIEKAIDPFRNKVYGRCSIRYKTRNADASFYGTTVKDIIQEIARK